MSKNADRPTTTEIEVTPEMIAAGEAAWCLFDRGDPLEWKLAAIFRSMEVVHPGTESRACPALPAYGAECCGT